MREGKSCIRAKMTDIRRGLRACWGEGGEVRLGDRQGIYYSSDGFIREACEQMFRWDTPEN